jgi:hypothetical protein
MLTYLIKITSMASRQVQSTATYLTALARQAYVITNAYCVQLQSLISTTSSSALPMRLIDFIIATASCLSHFSIREYYKGTREHL